jgi:hypothetical protein
MVQSLVEIGAVTPPDDPLRGTRRSSPYAGDVAGTYTIERSRSSVRELAAGFEAMLLQAAFAPLAKAIGFYGETVVGIATRSMLRDDSGLTSTFERALPQDAGR